MSRETNPVKRNGKNHARIHVEVPWGLHLKLLSRSIKDQCSKCHVIRAALAAYLSKQTPVMDEDDR